MNYGLRFFLSWALITFIGAVSFGQNDWQEKVDIDLLTRLNQQEVSFFVLLEDQISTSKAEQLTGKKVKTKFVFEALKSVVKESQAPVTTILNNANVSYQSFWLVNCIKTKGDKTLIKALASLPNVAKIMPNAKLQHAPVQPNRVDPQLGRNGGIEWGITKIQADKLWDKGITGEGVLIGGQDTGYEWDHPALKNQYKGWDGSAVNHNYSWHDAIHGQVHIIYDTNPCGYDSQVPCDDHGHGTHTMGTMVGDDPDTSAIGVAPGAEWIACRDMDQGWGDVSTYLECFEWFLAPTDLNGENPNTDKAPHVINNSWACPPSENCKPSNFEVLRMAVENMRNAGVVVVVSAGNEGLQGCETVRYPAAIYGESFSIGASTSSDEVANFSSRGNVTIDSSLRIKPDVIAPGVNVLSAIRNGKYGLKNGTSMAAPHVAGAIALLISADPSLAGEVDYLEELLEYSATPIFSADTCGGILGTEVPNNAAGYGQINLWKALEIIRPDLTKTEYLKTDQLRVYPNPFSDQVTFITPETMGNCTFRITNMLGQQVSKKTTHIGRLLDLDLSYLPNGSYIITVDNKEHCFSGRVVKY
ncbi:MAG: S8 family serine peptidase [Aureispira sp.]|nr:S8 family serine peptidase [Aureispira sp.]